ncbi:MAG: hypothetical protein ACK4RZ_01580 [Paracoccaceae bacterium]
MDRILFNIGPIPAWAIATRTGHVAKGDGGEWLPQSVDVGSGRYLSAVYAVDPTRRGVCLYSPVWTCPDAALYAAQKAAQQMAA